MRGWPGKAGWALETAGLSATALTTTVHECALTGMYSFRLFVADTNIQLSASHTTSFLCPQAQLTACRVSPSVRLAGLSVLNIPPRKASQVQKKSSNSVKIAGCVVGRKKNLARRFDGRWAML